MHRGTPCEGGGLRDHSPKPDLNQEDSSTGRVEVSIQQTPASGRQRISVEQFLETLFPRAEGVVIVASKEDGFRARRYVSGRTYGEILYFGISSVQDIPRAHVLQRREVDLVKTYVIVLDDIGTKVDEDQITLKPTYKLQTSPGNQQWGYRLKYGIEPTHAKALIEGAINAGITDPGAHGATRIMRVPASLNDKYDMPFWAEIVEWNVEIAYTYSELAVGLKVTPTDVVPAFVARKLGDGETDKLFEWLMVNGYVIKGPNPAGWYAVHCPWETEHTGKVDHGTDYLPGKPGIFKCLHSHGAEKNTAALRRRILDLDPDADLAWFDHEMIKNVAERLKPALEAFQGGGLFNLPRPVDKASLSLAERLAAATRSISLDQMDLPDFDRTVAGHPSRTQATTNARVHAVMRKIGMEARLNVSTGGIECHFPAIPEYDQVNDNYSAATEALFHACVRCGMRSSQAVRQGLANWATAHSYSPVSEWILSSPWDGRSRIGELCDTIVMRDPSDRLWKAVAIRRWLLQTVAAIRNWELGPNAVDVGHVLVLQGPQGVGKSRWTGSLMPAKWISLGLSLRLDSNERDAVRRVTSTPITELGEIDGSFRKSDVASLKNFLTTRIDIYRPAYAPTEVARPRGTSFVATVNPEGFLVDQTGERRFWPLAVANCDWNHGVDMQQLWAEAWALREEGEQYWLTTDEMTLHANVSARHQAETDVGYVVEELVVRRNEYPHKDWVHTNAKALARHYGLKAMTVVYTDLYSALERAGFRKKTRDGRRGILVPPFTSPLTHAQQASFQLIKGGQKDDCT